MFITQRVAEDFTGMTMAAFKGGGGGGGGAFAPALLFP